MTAAAQDFAKDVYPIFVKECQGCHAAGVKMGALDLETWEGVAQGGNNGPIFVAGNSGESRLIWSLTGKLGNVMPMGARMLPAAEIDAIRKWIDGGAKPPKPGELAGGGEPVQAFSPDGRWRASVGADNLIQVLAVESGKPVSTLKGRKGAAVLKLAWSADGKWLVAAMSDGALQVFRAAEFREVGLIWPLDWVIWRN